MAPIACLDENPPTALEARRCLRAATLTMWHRLSFWLRGLLHPAATRRDIDEELRFHLAREVERNIASGLAPQEAHEKARRAIGNLGLHRETALEATSRAGLALERFMNDVGNAVRTLRRAPGFASIVVLSLALSIGATTTIFSIADALLFRTLAVDAPDQLVTLEQQLPDGRRLPNFAYSDYDRFRERTDLFSGMTVTTWADGFNVASSGGVDEHQEHISIVSGSFFRMLGVRAALGRVFTDDEDRELGAHPVAVLSDAYWERR